MKAKGPHILSELNIFAETQTPRRLCYVMQFSEVLRRIFANKRIQPEKELHWRLKLNPSLAVLGNRPLVVLTENCVRLFKEGLRLQHCLRVGEPVFEFSLHKFIV